MKLTPLEAKMLDALNRVQAVINMSDCEHPDFRDSCADCIQELWQWEPWIREAIGAAVRKSCDVDKPELPDVVSLLKPVDQRGMLRLWSLWLEAQKLRDVPRMEELLSLRFLRYWWALRFQVPSAREADPIGAVEYILQKAGLLPVPPERPSERAMRLASADKPAIESRRKPLPLP